MQLNGARLPAATLQPLAFLSSRPTVSELLFIRGILGNTDAISLFSFINVSKNVFL
ncbi:MAG: hypothetical protein XE07_0380 [Methanothrix harundinacea]|jgi:hypothetical protein|uniref:Uncharacterized protein n=1 Tax=Methanothrix harundinacea TaxID=301375 RepID=A0A101ILR6_9EURY|nr:MAG: hypothetical protein XE07_0380 [Methanothrix harundinacea]